MYAVRHPAVRNLWFDLDRCSWTFDIAARTQLTSEQEARDLASLTQDGGIVIKIA